jgi:hypothetical protein
MARSTTTAKPRPPAKPPAPGKPPPKPGAAKRRRGKNTGSAAITLTVMAIAVLALTALPLCLLMLAGLLPTGVAVLIDRHRRRYLARTVGAMNLAGVIPGALRMWEAGISFASLQQVIGSPYTWLVMYGAAGIGWVLYFCVPPIVAMVIEVRVDETRRRLEARTKVLVEEWGEEVTGRQR